MMTWTKGLAAVTASLLLLAGCGGAPDGSRESSGSAQASSGSAASAELRSVTLTIPSMSCPLCSRPIEERLKEAGVGRVDVDLDRKLVTARFDPATITLQQIRTLVEDLGFPITAVEISGS